MGRNTSPLDNAGKEEYINAHLFNELHWLLHAATEWRIQADLQLNIAGYNVQNYAMDSAFLHARTLFEFFLNETTGNYYGCSEFLGAGVKLRSGPHGYTDDWSGPLHSFLMHAQDRSKPRQLQSPDGPKDINQMPVDFANEVLRLWKEFEDKLCSSSDPESQKLGAFARGKREKAIKNAECVVNSKVAQKHATERHQTLKPIF